MLERYQDARIRSVVLVDQSRQNEHWLSELPGVDQVLAFPINNEQVEILGHDHPTSLNRALAEATINTSHVLILDSDCFPVAHNWLDSLSDVTLASDPNYWSLSHPCFMFFPMEMRDAIDFSEGVAEIGMDTGRLVAAQLARAGLSVSFSRPTPAFRGYRGHLYLDGRLYHHGSASFISSPDARLSRQVNPRREEIFRRFIERGEYDLPAGTLFSMRTRGALDRAKRQLRMSS